MYLLLLLLLKLELTATTSVVVILIWQFDFLDLTMSMYLNNSLSSSFDSENFYSISESCSTLVVESPKGTDLRQRFLVNPSLLQWQKQQQQATMTCHNTLYLLLWQRFRGKIPISLLCLFLVCSALKSGAVVSTNPRFALSAADGRGEISMKVYCIK